MSVLNRFNKFSPLIAATATSLAVALTTTGCQPSREEEVANLLKPSPPAMSEMRYYRDPQACASAGIYTREFCDKSYNEARADHLKNAPSYAARPDCEKDFSQCEERSGQRGTVFVPYQYGYGINNIYGAQPHMIPGMLQQQNAASLFEGKSVYSHKGQTVTAAGSVLNPTGATSLTRAAATAPATAAPISSGQNFLARTQAAAAANTTTPAAPAAPAAARPTQAAAPAQSARVSPTTSPGRMSGGGGGGFSGGRSAAPS